MKKVFVLLFVLLLFSLLFLKEQPKKEHTEAVYSFLPLCGSSCRVVNHTYYTLCYNEKHEQAAWVYYVLSDSMIAGNAVRSEEHTSELQSRRNIVCRLLLEKKKKNINNKIIQHVITHVNDVCVDS